MNLIQSFCYCEIMINYCLCK